MRIERSHQGITFHKTLQDLGNPNQYLKLPKSIDLNFADRSLTFNSAKGKPLTYDRQDITHLRLFYRNPGRGNDRHRSIGLVLTINQRDLFLNNGNLTFPEATELAHTLTQHLQLPQKPPYRKPSFPAEPALLIQSATPRILLQNASHLIYRQNTATPSAILFALIISGLLTLATFLFLLFRPDITASIAPWGLSSLEVAFYGSLFIEPLILILILLAQTLGLSKVWTFDRTTDEIKYDRQHLIGKTTQKFFNHEVTALHFRTLIAGNARSPETYRISLEVPKLSLKIGDLILKRDREIYSNTDLQAATEFADRLRYYLRLQTTSQ
jgi:hypothetical protein